MQAYFEDVKVVGNIGIPYTSVAADTTDETVTVAEISSFQLETAVDFHPKLKMFSAREVRLIVHFLGEPDGYRMEQ